MRTTSGTANPSPRYHRNAVAYRLRAQISLALDLVRAGCALPADEKLLIGRRLALGIINRPNPPGSELVVMIDKSASMRSENTTASRGEGNLVVYSYDAAGNITEHLWPSDGRTATNADIVACLWPSGNNDTRNADIVACLWPTGKTASCDIVEHLWPTDPAQVTSPAVSVRNGYGSYRHYEIPGPHPTPQSATHGPGGGIPLMDDGSEADIAAATPTGITYSTEAVECSGCRGGPLDDRDIATAGHPTAGSDTERLLGTVDDRLDVVVALAHHGGDMTVEPGERFRGGGEASRPGYGYDIWESEVDPFNGERVDSEEITATREEAYAAVLVGAAPS